jgi:anaerobic magnesium-protoporphyrin IX monomethyl ester cyclase
MVYGDKYSAYDAQATVNTIFELAQKYGVRRFAFNDEAIPPKIVASLGELLPIHASTGFTFTGLIKFEKYFQAKHFTRLADVGFRSLYIGLESASERVLTLMKKRATQAEIIGNLRSATDAGIWTHCFLFFGFPGESNSDAQATYDFVMTNSNIIGSFGGGTFVLEHNAPIQTHPEAFGVTIVEDRQRSDTSVYYDYTVSSGISQTQAAEWCERLTADSMAIDKYRSTGWIPREFMLCLISKMTASELVQEALEIDRNGGIPPMATLRDVANLIPADHRFEAFAVNRMRLAVSIVKNQYHDFLDLWIRSERSAVDLAELNDRTANWLCLGAPRLKVSDLATINIDAHLNDAAEHPPGSAIRNPKLEQPFQVFSSVTRVIASSLS